MIKIAFVINDLSYGGAQTMLLQLIQNLDKRKYELRIYVRESALNTEIEKNLSKLGFECVFFQINDNNYSGPKLVHKVKSVLKFNNQIKKFKPDIIHAHLESQYSAIYSIIYNTQYIFTIHSFPDRILTKQFKLLLNIIKRRHHLRLVGCADCVSNRAVEMLGKGYSVITKTIYNPIDLDVFHFHNPTNKVPIFISVARMHPIKNQRLLLDAFYEVTKIHRESKLIIVGDGELRAELEEKCEGLGIRNNVDFMGNRADIPRLLGLADIFVLSSDSECCPMTILEAMASGLPIVSTDVGGIGEIVGECGLLVPPQNCKSLAKAMLEIYENDTKRIQMGIKASNRVKNFETSTITNEYSKLYDSVLKRKEKNE